MKKIRIGIVKENISMIPRTQTYSSACNVSPNKPVCFPNGILNKHIRCPLCSSAAKKLYGKKFGCKSGTCKSEFCSACLKNWQPSHEVVCKEISCSPKSSPSKLLLIKIPVQPLIGNILSRKRLKRILK